MVDTNKSDRQLILELQGKVDALELALHGATKVIEALVKSEKRANATPIP